MCIENTLPEISALSIDEVPAARLRLLQSGSNDVAQLLRTFKLEHFPSIKMDDPWCRYMGGKVGDVFEMKSNLSSGYQLSYKRVVACF